MMTEATQTHLGEAWEWEPPWSVPERLGALCLLLIAHPTKLRERLEKHILKHV